VVDALNQRPHIFSVILLKVDSRDQSLRAQDEDDWSFRFVMYGKNICKNNMEGYFCDDDGMVRFMKKIVGNLDLSCMGKIFAKTIWRGIFVMMMEW
jgi:hypothetical protein